MSSLEVSQIIQIRSSLKVIDALQERIDELDREIQRRIVRRKNDLRIAIPIPGMGFISAAAILAEIGNYADFKNAEQLASWYGLVPSLYQSAEKAVSGGITKHGSKHIWMMLIQVAYAISRTKGSKLKRFFLRIQAKKGSKVAAVALARKVLCILFSLLTKQENYQEDTTKRNKSIKLDKTQPPEKISLKEMIGCLVRAILLGAYYVSL